MKRLVVSLLAAFASSPAFAQEPDLSSPAATARTYLLATKANDVETAKKCWTINDDNVSGTLDVVVGMWIETRRLVTATQAKFGADGLKFLGRWNRPSCTDRAIDCTLERVAAASVRRGETAARLVVAWTPEDRESDPAFLCDAPFRLRRVGGEWKLDASVLTEQGRPFWAVWRDEMAVMKDLTAGIEKGQFKDVADFERELKARVAALKAKYERKD